MQFDNLEGVRGITKGHDTEEIEEDSEVPSNPIKTESKPAEFVIGRPYGHEVCKINVESEAEIYATVEGRRMGSHFYIREDDQVVRVGNDPIISKSPKIDWPDLEKKVKDDEDYNGQDTVNTERWAWRMALGNQEPELSHYLIGIN